MAKNIENNEVEINEDDFKVIFADEYNDFCEKIIPNCFCSHCRGKYSSPEYSGSIIVNYRSFINDLNDVILRGFCSLCGNKIGRYVETGEMENTAKMAGQIKNKYKNNFT